MSDFLVIIPEGWKQIDIAASGMSAETIVTASLQTITEMLRIAGLIAETDVVEDFRILGGEVFAVRLVA